MDRALCLEQHTFRLLRRRVKCSELLLWSNFQGCWEQHRGALAKLHPHSSAPGQVGGGVCRAQAGPPPGPGTEDGVRG